MDHGNKTLPMVTRSTWTVHSSVKTTFSGVAKPGLTRTLARASAHLALASEIDDYMINLYSLQSVA